METVKILKKTKKPTKHTVYDIAVKDAHHYILSDGLVSHNSYVPTNELAGGSGFKYAASTIAMLSKSKEREGTEVVGNLIKVKMYKSRLSKENGEVVLRLSYKTGLDKYYGLLDLAEKSGIFKKVSTRYELPDGTKIFGKNINEEPEKYFTPEILTLLDKAAKERYSYGSSFADTEEEFPEVEG